MSIQQTNGPEIYIKNIWASFGISDRNFDWDWDIFWDIRVDDSHIFECIVAGDLSFW